MKLSEQVASNVSMNTLVNMLAELMLYQATHDVPKSQTQFVIDVWSIGAQRAKQTGQDWQAIMDSKFEQLKHFQDNPEATEVAKLRAMGMYIFD